MNFNKVFVITNELSNQKEYIPLGDIHITDELTVKELVKMVSDLKEDLGKDAKNLATFKTEMKQNLAGIQARLDNVVTLVQTNKNLATAEIINIKESIKLLGGVL